MGRNRKPKEETTPDGFKRRYYPDTGYEEFRKVGKVRYADDSRHTGKTGWFPTKVEVLAAWEALVEESARRGDPQHEETLMDMIIKFNLWLDSSDNERLGVSTNNTIEGIGSVLEKTMPDKIGKTKMRKFGKETVSAWARYYCTEYIGCTGKHPSRNYFGNHKKYISKFLDWLYVYTNWAEGQPEMVTICKMILPTIRVPGDPEDRNRDMDILEEDEYWTLEEFMKVLNSIPFEPVEYTPIIGPEQGYWRTENPDLAAVPYPILSDGLQNAADFVTKGVPLREVRQYVFLVLSFFTGTRFEETRALRWDAVRFNDGMLDIKTAKNYRIKGSPDRIKKYLEAPKTLKNRSSDRTIPMLPPVTNALLTYKYIYMQAYGTDEGLLFIPERHSKDGMLSPNSAQNWMDKLSAEAGVHHLSPHGLRHSCATYLAVDMDLDEDVAAEFFGHTDQNMLHRVYQHKKKMQKAKRMEAEFIKKGALGEDWAAIAQKAKTLDDITKALRQTGHTDTRIDPDK